MTLQMQLLAFHLLLTETWRDTGGGGCIPLPSARCSLNTQQHTYKEIIFRDAAQETHRRSVAVACLVSTPEQSCPFFFDLEKPIKNVINPRVFDRTEWRMRHISYRLFPKWKPTKVRDGRLEKRSQYLWILNMWHTSLPTNLSNKSTPRLYGLAEITKCFTKCFCMFQIWRSAMGLVVAKKLCAIWHAACLFVF